MKTTSPLKKSKEAHLKVIKNHNNIMSKHNTSEKMYINTLIPNFNYLDKLGKIIKPKKCIML